MAAFHKVRIPLNRPQYVPSPEVLVSSLLHRHFSNAELVKAKKGLRFLEVAPARVAVTTGPDTPEALTEFGEDLRDAGMKSDVPNVRELAEAVVDGVKGVRPPNSRAIPVSPITPHLALAQDLRGVLGAANPPAMGAVLETMYLLGAPIDEPAEASMGERWLAAAERRMSLDPVLTIVDKAFSAQDVMTGFERREAAPLSGIDGWVGRFSESSPFSWLRRHWDRLMSPAWVEALPARIWTDWSTMLLRTALGFGFLWESRWYALIGSALLGSEPVREAPRPSVDPLLPWPPSRLPVSSRNVKGEIERTVSRGLEVQLILESRMKEEAEGTALSVLEAMRTNEEVRAEVRKAMGGEVRNLRIKNTYETIRYALQQRSTQSMATDYYGLLRPRGSRYSVVAPGTEWIAVVASLACQEPGQETHVGSVMQSLEELGLRPELQEIVQLLESAGLAEGSADADHGVRVRSAF